MSRERNYIAIDLKSFYASVECMDRGLDPLKARLVVADKSRTDKTICLAVSPALKAYGIPGRARLFEVVQKTRALGIDYITATPRMSRYIEMSVQIYNIYRKYVAPEDMHVYSIDEVFLDVTDYLHAYEMTARELAIRIIHDVLEHTGITATAGIGPNLYLAKIAMDIEAKHVPADADGVRIAELTEMSYREKLWNYEPLTDFWRIGRGTAKKLISHGIRTMGDIARCSLGGPADFHNEELLYRLFGVNAELLIDHAWGWEPCTIADIKAHRPASRSLTQGQVLTEATPFATAKIIAKEMADALALELTEKGLVTDQLNLFVGYDVENLTDGYSGEIVRDWYGRSVPKPAHGSLTLPHALASSPQIVKAVAELFERIVDPDLTVRRLNLSADVRTAEEQLQADAQISMFDVIPDQPSPEELEKDRKVQEAILNIKKKYGKNAILKGMSFEEGATGRQRNEQIGGHKA